MSYVFIKYAANEESNKTMIKKGLRRYRELNKVKSIIKTAVKTIPNDTSIGAIGHVRPYVSITCLKNEPLTKRTKKSETVKMTVRE
jgi:hypothetical protein